MISVKLGGQLAVDAGAVGSAVTVQPTPLHGVGLGALGAGGHDINVTGPAAANAVRHGTKRSALPPAALMMKWNAPLAGQPTSFAAVSPT
jgi:hypothetical protein